MAWVHRLFRKGDGVVLLAGVSLMLGLASLLMNKFMFQPVRGGYDESLDGYVDIGTNGVSIAARLKGDVTSGKVVLYCHGNAEDMTAIDGRFHGSVEKGCAVAIFDYPGYGLSAGSPTEKGCYRNAHRLYDWLTQEKGVAPENLIVVGYSIGTGVATELAATRKVGGLWLEAPYLSAPRIVTRVRILPVDPFPSYRRIRDVKCPISILHGTKDTIIPFSQGLALYECAPSPKRFVTVEGANHTNFVDFLGFEQYEEMLIRFIRNPAEISL